MTPTSPTETREDRFRRWFDLAETEKEARLVKETILDTLWTAPDREMAVTLWRLRVATIRGTV